MGDRSWPLLAVAIGLACAGAAAQEGAANGVVEGRVLGPLGEPMVGVEVWRADWQTPDQVIARTRTDGEGMFVLGKVPPRTVSLFASAPGLTIGQEGVLLSPEQPRAGATLRLWEANTLRGRVRDADGKPVVGAHVLGTRDFTFFDGRFQPPEARSDAAGRFELPGVPAGDCVVRVWAEGFVLRESRLTALADAEVEVALERGDGVQLPIRVDGLPAGVQPTTAVWIYGMRGGSGFNLPRVMEHGALDGAGRFRLAGLPDAEWHVEPTSPDYTFDPRSVTAKAGAPVPDLLFRATRNGSLRLRGTLRGASGEPLAGEQLICRTKRSQSMNGGTPGRATTDAQGHFAMDAPLAEGEPYSLHLVNSKWVLLQEKVDGMKGLYDARYLVRYEDVADPGRELALAAVPAALVTAKLVDVDGRPVPFQWTELQERRANRMPEWMEMAYATSARDGSLAFSGVHGGTGDLRVHTEGIGGAGASDVFTLDTGDHRELVVRVQRAGVIEGRVLDGKGRPVPAARVSLRNHDVATGQQTDGGWSNVPSDRQGRFRFVGVAPGGHRLELDTMLHGARVVATPVFAVAPGATVVQDVTDDR
jgi:protocatechuate 3,4-dioxygenase beta subunit